MFFFLLPGTRLLSQRCRSTIRSSLRSSPRLLRRSKLHELRLSFLDGDGADSTAREACSAVGSCARPIVMRVPLNTWQKVETCWQRVAACPTELPECLDLQGWGLALKFCATTAYPERIARIPWQIAANSAQQAVYKIELGRHVLSALGEGDQPIVGQAQLPPKQQARPRFPDKPPHSHV